MLQSGGPSRSFKNGVVKIDTDDRQTDRQTNPFIEPASG